MTTTFETRQQAAPFDALTCPLELLTGQSDPVTTAQLLLPEAPFTPAQPVEAALPITIERPAGDPRIQRPIPLRANTSYTGQHRNTSPEPVESANLTPRTPEQRAAEDVGLLGGLAMTGAFITAIPAALSGFQLGRNLWSLGKNPIQTLLNTDIGHHLVNNGAETAAYGTLAGGLAFAASALCNLAKRMRKGGDGKQLGLVYEGDEVVSLA